MLWPGWVPHSIIGLSVEFANEPKLEPQNRLLPFESSQSQQLSWMPGPASPMLSILLPPCVLLMLAAVHWIVPHSAGAVQMGFLLTVALRLRCPAATAAAAQPHGQAYVGLCPRIAPGGGGGPCGRCGEPAIMLRFCRSPTCACTRRTLKPVVVFEIHCTEQGGLLWTKMEYESYLESRSEHNSWGPS